MQRRFGVAALAVATAGLVASSTARAINHTSDYKTNMGNYRTCTDPLLDTCGFADVLSPSNYYLTNGSTTTVIYQANGTVQLRIDAGGISTDTDVSYTCADTQFQCVSSLCASGPRQGSACTANRCFGGSNNGAVCSSASACPGGSCTAGAACVAQTCQTGPRAGLECGGAQPACTSTASTTGWHVVFRGNDTSAVLNWPVWNYQLRGDSGGSGCMKVCPFSLDGNGAVNSSGLANCTSVGNCGGLETFHYVEIRDPDDEVLAIPTVGTAAIESQATVEGDPAQVGD